MRGRRVTGGACGASPARSSLLANAAWLAADRAVRLGGGLLIGVWMARYLGPAQFGLLSYAIAFAALFGTLSTLGLDGIVVRDLVAGATPPGVLLGTALRLRVAGAALALLLATGIAACAGSDGAVVAMVAIGSAVFLAQSLSVIDWYYQAIGRNRPSVLAQNGGFLVSAALKAMLIVAKAPVLAFALCNLAEAVLAGLFLLWLYRRSPGQAGCFDRQVARRLLAESWPLILSGIAFTIYVRVDQVMIGRMLGEAQVGLYSAAIRLSETWNLVPVIAVTAAFPPLLAQRATDRAAYDSNMQRLFSALAAVSIAVALATELLGDRVVLLLYGRGFAGAAPILKISIWSAIFASLGYAGGRWLIAENQARYALLRNLIGVGVNVGLNLVLIPRQGAKGAAIGTLVSYIFANLLAYATRRSLHPLLWINLKALLLIGLHPRARAVA